MGFGVGAWHLVVLEFYIRSPGRFYVWGFAAPPPPAPTLSPREFLLPTPTGDTKFYLSCSPLRRCPVPAGAGL